MSVWTTEDLEELKNALKSGVLSVTYAGPPARTVTYQSLRAMRELLASMERDVNGATTYRLVKWNRGFRDGC